ncbi:MAG: hypothetical protein L6R41_002631 [Letrouitia leprolyta]|nr:MAG: hypothetical protein L6R41_002631 [Letrouitia leprolyta]
MGIRIHYKRFQARLLVYCHQERYYRVSYPSCSFEPWSTLPLFLHILMSYAGVGVGDASASPTTALLFSILQESTGRIATILFADRLGTALEPECKMYRLAADVFNDAAMLLDCLSPALPRGPRVLLLSSSSVLRALCGVAAGSSKASLSAHFAKWGNLGELNAKDSSQETVISLLGMLVGSVVVSYVSSPAMTWTCLILLLSVHLGMNRAAVRAVSMHSLNRQRANIVFSTFLDQDKVLTPKEVSVQERIFEWDGVLRWRGSSPLARGRIGLSMRDLVASLAPAHPTTGSIRDREAKLMRFIRLYSKEEFLVWYDAPQRVGYISLREGAAVEWQLKAWALMLWIVHRHPIGGGADATSASFESAFDLHRATLQDLSSRWTECVNRMRTAGWDMDVGSLETSSGSRIRIQAMADD